MKHLGLLTVWSVPIVVALCAAGWFGTATARSSASVDALPAAKTPQPRIISDAIVHRFGEMPVGGTARHTFNISNAGDAPLTLEQGTTSCKCTLSKIARNEIAPGESGTIELEWKPDKPAAAFDKSAMFRTNDPLRPSFSLSISGKVLPKVEYSPSTTWLVGELLPAPTESKGMVYSRSIDAFQIKSVRAADPRVRTAIKPLASESLKALGARCGFELAVACDGAFPIGPFESFLTVETDQHAEPQQILLRGERPVPLRLSGRNWNPGTRTLHFQTFSAVKGARQVATVLIDGGPDGKSARVIDAACDEPGLKVQATPLSQADGQRQAYRIDVTAPAGSSPFRRTDSNVAHVKLRTTHPEVPEFQFAVSVIAY